MAFDFWDDVYMSSALERLRALASEAAPPGSFARRDFRILLMIFSASRRELIAAQDTGQWTGTQVRWFGVNTYRSKVRNYTVLEPQLLDLEMGTLSL